MIAAFEPVINKKLFCRARLLMYQVVAEYPEALLRGNSPVVDVDRLGGIPKKLFY
jgi:hypothetical protein